jgi:hypothetical protein
MPIRFFLGACFLTWAVLAPHAGVVSIAEGMALGGLILWLSSRRSGGGPRDVGG